MVTCSIQSWAIRPLPVPPQGGCREPLVTMLIAWDGTVHLALLDLAVAGLGSCASVDSGGYLPIQGHLRGLLVKKYLLRDAKHVGGTGDKSSGIARHNSGVLG